MGNINSRYEQRPKPTGLKFGIIEVTTECQNRCPGCYMVRRDALNKGEMSLQQAIRVLDLCKEYCGKELETMDILGGEPLLWPFLQDYIEELLRRQIQPWIFTNMLAITPGLAGWLYELGVYITGKLNINPNDSSQLALQAKMIGRRKEVARKMIASIDIFMEAGYKAPLFRLQNLIRKSNITLVAEYYRWCLGRNIGTDLELMGSGEAIGQDYWQIAPTIQQIIEMIKEVQAVRGEFGLEPAEVLMPHIFGACPFYDKGLYFGVDGHIRTCSNSVVRLADVNDPDPIKLAYESSLICNRCLLTQETIGEPCHSCDKWEKCRGGCRSTAEGMGNPLGGYTLCPVPFLS
ncbi:MAG: 4Fe-4S cluster-binding domain-containing protein [Candidatus Gribaldobacteria bacterium]|nr:4Fe-4S cluster-binding domain-containing protein [Candidatus Gribaldobacteria bacterium]